MIWGSRTGIHPGGEKSLVSVPCYLVPVVFTCQLEKPQYKGLTQRGLFFSRNRSPEVGQLRLAAVLLGVIRDPVSFYLSAQLPLAYGFPPNTR